MSILGDLFPAIAKKKEEEQREYERQMQAKKENQVHARALIEQARKGYRESVLFSADIKMPYHSNRETPLVLTENRILFTVFEIHAAGNVMVLVDIPYSSIYELERARNAAYGLTVIWLENGRNHSHYLWSGSPSGSFDLKSTIEKYAEGKMTGYFQPRGAGSTQYVNICWKCGARINSDANKRCPVCKMFICSHCGACMCDYTPGKK